MDMDMGMHMSFWFGNNLQGFIFPNLNITSSSGLTILCLVIFALTIFYESLKLCLAKAKYYSSILRCPNHAVCLSEATTLTTDTASLTKKRYLWFVIEMVVYIFEVSFAYLLMLIVMSYNGYVFLTVILATTLAYVFMGTRIMDIKIKSSRMSTCSSCVQPPKTSPYSSTVTMASVESLNDAPTNDCCTSTPKVHATVHT